MQQIDEIKGFFQAYGDFSNFIAIVDYLIFTLRLKFGETDSKVRVTVDGKGVNKQNLSQNDLVRIKRIQAVLKSYKLVQKCSSEDVFEILSRFEGYLDDEKMRQIFSADKLDEIKDMLAKYHQICPKVIKMVDFLLNTSAKEIFDLIEQDGRLPVEIRFYVGGGGIRLIKEMYVYKKIDNDLREEILDQDALHKIMRMKIKNINVAKRVCEKRIVNIFQPGLIIHNTKSSFWHPETIVKFIKRGLRPSASEYTLGGFTCFEDMVSFYMITSGDVSRWFFEGDAIFIIDPEFVRNNHTHFFYNASDDDDEYVEYAKKFKFGPMLDPTHAWINEVQSDIPIPFSAIFGVIVLKDKFLNRIKLFMYKLLRFHPELVFPIYDQTGKVIFPDVK